jgi:hypothetical protein
MTTCGYRTLKKTPKKRLGQLTQTRFKGTENPNQALYIYIYILKRASDIDIYIYKQGNANGAILISLILSNIPHIIHQNHTPRTYDYHRQRLTRKATGDLNTQMDGSLVFVYKNINGSASSLPLPHPSCYGVREASL